MVIWKLKACPRCGGDTYIDRDLDQLIQHCLMCGFSRELGPTAVTAKEPEKTG